jgi:hypothetical protein
MINSAISAFAQLFNRASYATVRLSDHLELKRLVDVLKQDAERFREFAADRDAAADKIRLEFAEYRKEVSATLEARRVAIARMEKEAAAAHDREQAVVLADRHLSELGANGAALLALAGKTRVSKADKDMLVLMAGALGHVRSVANTAPRNLREAAALLARDQQIRELNDNGEEKRLLEKANDAQAARAMARNMKNDFVVFQHCVHTLTDELDKLCSKNSVTKDDLQRIRDLRAELRDVAGRKV